MDRSTPHSRGPRAPAYADPTIGPVQPFATQVRAWFVPHHEVLTRLGHGDAAAVLAWQRQTLEDGAYVFGMRCPTAMVVTAAGAHLHSCDDLSPALCALRESVRQRDAVVRVTSRLAHNDVTWAVLLDPILRDMTVGTAIDDTALLILLDQHFGSAADAVWRVLQTWHRERFGEPPRITRADYDLCVT